MSKSFELGSPILSSIFKRENKKGKRKKISEECAHCNKTYTIFYTKPRKRPVLTKNKEFSDPKKTQATNVCTTLIFEKMEKYVDFEKRIY